MAAAAKGHLQVVEMLTQRGADRDLKDNNGRTAAQYARDQNHGEIATLLELRFADGVWQGTTSQGKPIRFRIQKSRVAGPFSVTYAKTLQNPYGPGVIYSGESQITSEFNANEDASNGRFQISYMSFSRSGNSDVEVVLITGKATSDTTAVGTFTTAGQSPGPPLGITWKAHRTK